MAFNRAYVSCSRLNPKEQGKNYVRFIEQELRKKCKKMDFMIVLYVYLLPYEEYIYNLL